MTTNAEATRFFEEVVPRLARGRARAFPALGQPATIIVEREAWTLRLHDEDKRVVRGPDPQAGFTLWLSAEAFTRLLDGTLDLDAAVRARAVGVTGDLRYLEQLGRLLGGARSSVGVRGSAP